MNQNPITLITSNPMFLVEENCANDQARLQSENFLPLRSKTGVGGTINLNNFGSISFIPSKVKRDK